MFDGVDLPIRSDSVDVERCRGEGLDELVLATAEGLSFSTELCRGEGVFDLAPFRLTELSKDGLRCWEEIFVEPFPLCIDDEACSSSGSSSDSNRRLVDEVSDDLLTTLEAEVLAETMLRCMLGESSIPEGMSLVSVSSCTSESRRGGLLCDCSPNAAGIAGLSSNVHMPIACVGCESRRLDMSAGGLARSIDMKLCAVGLGSLLTAWTGAVEGSAKTHEEIAAVPM